MKIFILTSLGLVLLFYTFLSCASHITQNQRSYSKTLTEVKELQSFCKNSGIHNQTVATADSFLVVSTEFLEKGNEKESFYNALLAVTHYQLALTRQENEGYKNKISDLEKNLSSTTSELINFKSELINSKNEVTKYRKVLTGIDTIK